MDTTAELPTDARIGLRVSYEDMANPRQHGTICDIREIRICEGRRHITPMIITQYDVAFDDGTITSTDLRQRGWRIES